MASPQAAPTLKLTPESYYLLRRPLLPVSTLLALHTTGQADYGAFVSGLLALFEAEAMQEAIYTASPDLYRELLKLRQQPTEATAERNSRVIYSLYKYLLRSCTRATPYGLFAGCSLGQLGATTRLDFGANKYVKLTRLDMNYTQEIFQELSKSTALLENSTYYTNNSLYELDGQYRYIEYQVENKRRNYRLSSVARTDFLACILAEGRQGISYPRLLAVLAQAVPDATRTEAVEYVRQLIEAQLLINEYAPTITGRVYASELPQRLAGIVDEATVRTLTHVNELLVAGGVANFQQAHATLNEGLLSCSASELIQTDLFYEPVANQLSTNAAAGISTQLGELYALSTRSVVPELNTFIQEFSRRYEEQEVPLLLALDHEAGIGYGRAGGGAVYLPLVEDIQPSGTDVTSTTTWTATARLVQAKYQQAIATGGRTVELLPAELAALAADAPSGPDVPASLAALGSVLASSATAVDAGEFHFLLQSCGGPSAANLLGRFCYGDEALRQHLAASLARAEPDTDEVVYAEIVHAPEARVGNILMRPHLRTYEIPYLSLSTVAAEYQITAADLLVSVRDGRLVLRSQRLNKRVVPRLSTAHNVAKGLPLYRFLHDVQRHNLHTHFSWNWGAFKTSEFLPRVEYKNIVLERATWNLTAQLLLGRGGPLPPVAETERLIYAFYQTQKLPRYVTLVEGDNELLLDFEFSFSRMLLAQHLSKRPRAQLKEFLQLSENCIVTGEQQARYAHELIMPLHHVPAAPPAAAPSAGVATKPHERRHLPGGEWVYIKFYGGYKALEKLLTAVVAPLMRGYEASGEVKKWFFIRYNDPDAHLRLRLQLRGDVAALGRVLAEMHAAVQPLLAAGTLHRLQLDTYVQELERYGGPFNIDNTEDWFCCDSRAVLALLQLLDGDEGETYRWPLAVRGLDELLRDFGLTLPQKHELLRHLSAAFFREFQGNKALQMQLDAKYRKHAATLRSYLKPADDVRNGIEEATACFAERSRHGAACVGRIRALLGPELTASNQGTDLLASYAHMYLNRMIPDKARLHELVIYTLLYKCYTAQLAMAKVANGSPARPQADQLSGIQAG